jgi:hypothetical protein
VSAPTSKRGKLLNASEAAAYLGIGVEQFRHYVKRGLITVMRLPVSGRFVGAYERDLDEFQAKCRVPARTTDTAERRARTAGVDAAIKSLIGDSPRAFAH